MQAVEWGRPEPVGVVNEVRHSASCSMHHGDGRSVGYLAEKGVACSPSNPRHDGFLAFGLDTEEGKGEAPRAVQICSRLDPGFDLCSRARP